jgi:hypothetical protein
MDRVRPDNMRTVVVREFYSLLRPKIKLLGKGSALFKIGD